MRESNVYPLNIPSNICAHSTGCDGCVHVSPDPKVSSVGCISEWISTVLIEVLRSFSQIIFMKISGKYSYRELSQYRLFPRAVNFVILVNR